PDSPYPSCREPTRYTTFTVMVLLPESGNSRMRSPLGYVYSVIPAIDGPFCTPVGSVCAESDSVNITTTTSVIALRPMSDEFRRDMRLLLIDKRWPIITVDLEKCGVAATLQKPVW